MAPSWVKDLGGVQGSTASGLSITLTAGVAAGDSVLIATRGSGGTIATGATDSKGNTYTIDSQGTGGNTVVLFRGDITTALVAGDTITTTWSGTVTGLMCAAEYTRCVPGTAATPASVTGTSITCPSTGSLSVASACLLVSAESDAFAGASTPGGSFSARQNKVGTSAFVGLADLSVAAGSYTVSWSWSTSAAAKALLQPYTSPVADAVTVTNPGSQTGAVGTAITPLSIVASDTLSHTLTYSATGLPPGLSINTSTGVISGTPTTAGTYSSCNVVATCTGSQTDNKTFTWTIAAGTKRRARVAGSATATTSRRARLAGAATATDVRKTRVAGVAV